MNYSLKFVLAIAAAAAAGGGCADFYRTQADRAAYSTIKAGRGQALGERKPFGMEYSPLAAEGKGQSIAVGSRVITVGTGKAIKLTLDECLEIAFRSSRNLQNRKEAIYSSALTVANRRRSWNWPLADLVLDNETEHVKQHAQSEDPIASGTAELSITQRFIHGGVFTLAWALDAATDFATWNSQTFGSMLDANFTQPLLRGAWRGFAYEDQYRLERDFLFDVFEYERFTQTFTVDIVTDYYSVLQKRDELENEKSNIDRLKRTLALTEVLADSGQVSRIQEDQAAQDLLNAQLRLERTAEEYRNTLDAFKLTLGLPVGADVTVDYPASLSALREAGPKDIRFDEQRAIAVALSVRPDLLSERANVRDADRDVDIAADAFFPQLDLELGFTASDSGADRSARLRWNDHQRLVKATFNYSFDQTDNRDAYRNAMIDAARARRDLSLFEDNVRLSVRRSYRSLLRSRRSYELLLRSVEIALRRRKLSTLQQREGQASARDVLEAEESLRTAQNGLTSSLVSYTTTRLSFLADLGMIIVDEKGRLHEQKEPFGFGRIRRRYTYVGGE